MKAIQIHQFGGPDVLTYTEIPSPTPDVGQVVVRVQAIGVNPVETYIRSGIYGPRTFPFTPGTDAVGTIEAVGEGVTQWKPGDRVYTSQVLTGAYAEKVLAPESGVYRLPDNISFEQGASINVPYATAYRALINRAEGKAGETVLIHGASGGVGIAATQIAAALGCVVFGTAGTDEGRRLVQEQGATQTFDHGAEGYLEQAKAATPNGSGFNILLEMLANVNLGKDLPVLAPRGRVVVIGNRGTVQINPRDTMARDASILGMSLANASPDELRGIHAALFAGLSNGTLRPIVGKRFPLSDAAHAQEEIVSSKAIGKVILVP